MTQQNNFLYLKHTITFSSLRPSYLNKLDEEIFFGQTFSPAGTYEVKTMEKSGVVLDKMIKFFFLFLDFGGMTLLHRVRHPTYQITNYVGLIIEK